MTSESIQSIDRLAGQLLTPSRYQHTLNVMGFAVKHFGYRLPKIKIMQACLIHDIAKDLKGPLLDGCKLKVPGNIIRKQEPYRHCLAAGFIARNVLNIGDTDILEAVVHHSTGKPGLSLLGRILVVSDMCSKDRTYPGVEGLRRLARSSLEKAYLEALKNKICFVIKGNMNLLSAGVEAYNDQIKRMHQ